MVRREHLVAETHLLGYEEMTDIREYVEQAEERFQRQQELQLIREWEAKDAEKVARELEVTRKREARVAENKSREDDVKLSELEAKQQRKKAMN